MKRIYTMIPAEATRGQDRLSWLVFENNKLIAGFPSESCASAYMRQLQIIREESKGCGPDAKRFEPKELAMNKPTEPTSREP